MTKQGAESGTEKTQRRHCWECLRRRLVCDSTHPICIRCSTRGVICPGYDNSKPLKWLSPGRVTSRNRRLKGASSDKIEDDHNETTTRTKAELSRGTNNVRIPRLEMRTEICAAVEAVEYYNTCIYQDLIPINELGPNPHVYLISTTYLQNATRCPDHIIFSFICMTLSHQINRTRNTTKCKALAESFHQYRGAAIRSLSEDINVEHKRVGDFVIAGIITCLLADAQQGASPNWRCHLEGIQRLITLRGGFRALVESKRLDMLLLSFLYIAVMGNTSSPASDLFMTTSHLSELDFILQQYGSRTFAFLMCPPLLFAEIVKVNHLRMRATDPTGIEDLSKEAYGILSRVNGFSPEQWAESKPSSKEHWILLGNIYQTTVALYCISSLQSVSVLPLSSLLGARRSTHGQLLHTLLNEALSSPSIKIFMLWPLVVLGVEAVNGGTAMRAFVKEQLSEMSRYIGTYVPLTAKGVLERFWASGESRWDACFDRPYVFATQIAVDIQRILPSC